MDQYLQEADALLISSKNHISYLTGITHFSDVEREAYMFITKNKRYILTDARYAVKNSTYELQTIKHDNPFHKIMQNLLAIHHIQTLGIEENNLTVTEYKLLTSLANLIPAQLHTLRQIKTNKEIQHIRKACLIGDTTFAYIKKKIKPGMTEKTVAVLLELFIKQQPADISFAPIVAFGRNTAIPHHNPGKTVLKKNDIVLIDFGVKYNSYCSDMTRTFFVGKSLPEHKKIYQIVKTAQEKAQAYITAMLADKKEPLAAKADTVARNYITEQGYPSFSHALGHGIGLAVHESPTLSSASKDVLSEGMVFSIEPGIYLKDSMGVRIEDLFTIKNRKLLCLTKAI